MATLYINRPNLELRDDGSAIAVYQANQRQTTLPIKLIERLIIQHTTKLDSGLLLKLADAGASVLFLSARHSRRVAILLGQAHNDAAIRLAQALRITDPSFSNPLAQQLIQAKLKRQIHLLHSAQTERPDVRKPLFDALQSLRDIQHRLSDITNIDHPSLRGYEGAAARAYFQGFSSLFAPELNFTGRNRRPPRDPVNACLSLAYTLLHFDAVRAAHTAGLDPLLGFYHRPSYGRESLASDLIEPLRPHADAWVWQQFRQRNLRPDHFSFDREACLLGKAGREHFYQAWEQHAATHRRWLRQQSHHLAQQLRAEGLPLLANDDDEIE